jgi:hypothetical protein
VKPRMRSVALIACIVAVASVATAVNNNWPSFTPTFTGNVTRDFPASNAGVFIANDTIVCCGERDLRCHRRIARRPWWVSLLRGVQGEIGVLDEDASASPPPPRTPSGWDITDARFSYDPVDDILYVGINTGNCITGDAGALCPPIARFKFACP